MILAIFLIMNRSWLVLTFAIAFLFLGSISALEKRSLKMFYISEKVIKLAHFNEARRSVARRDLPYLKLWESILTGRSAPLPKAMKEKYRSLALSHIFTPSGFHLSAVLFPFMKCISSSLLQFYLLSCLGVVLFFLPGVGALKRMVLIKTAQNRLGIKAGFIAALCIDIILGTFQTSPLSFTYSFLFLGIIFSGLSGVGLIIWFFCAQGILACFQGLGLSPMLLLISPFLNGVFGALMPILLVLSYPLWSWQMGAGLWLLKRADQLVELSVQAIGIGPVMEMNVVTLCIFAFILCRWFRYIPLLLLLFSGSLNLDSSRFPSSGRFEFVPRRQLMTRQSGTGLYVKYRDGVCRVKLVRGIWFESCSPRRRSSRENT